MKPLAILLLSCLSLWAQHPLTTGSGIGWTKGASALADYTNNLYMDYESDTPTSLYPTNNGAVPVAWTNIVYPGPVNVSLNLVVPGGVAFPTVQNNQTPTGKPALDWSLNNSANNTWMNKQSNGSNQPNAFYVVLHTTGSQGGRIEDVSVGARTLLGFETTTIDFFAGSLVTLNTANLSGTWMVVTYVINGANSYVRTNGVLVGTGSPGSNGMGFTLLGNDTSLATPFKGQMSALRVYNEAPTTNNEYTVEQNLASRYLGIIIPHP